MAIVDNIPEDHGDPSTWAELDEEETRCLMGLKSYHVRIEDKPEPKALELAWLDLQMEHKRLLKFSWFKPSKKPGA